MLNIIKKIMPFTIVIGIIALIPILTLGTDRITIVKEASINYGTYTWNYYYLDIHMYLKNLQNSIESITFLQGMPLPPQAPTWTNTADIVVLVKFIANTILVYVANWIIYILECFTLVPLKLLLYPINFIAAILGYNTIDLDYIKMINTIYNWNVPYIPFM